MPLDMNMLLAAVREVAKEEGDALLKRFIAQMPEPSEVKQYDDTTLVAIIEAQQNEIASLKIQIGELSKRLLDEDAIVERLKAHIPAPVQGEKGDPGDKGEPGADGADGATVSVEDVVKALLGDRDFIKAVKGEPGDVGPGPTQGQVDAALEKQVADKMPDLIKWLREEYIKRADLPQHRGTYDSTKVYQTGDEVVKSDSTWRALEETNTAPPGPAWQLVAKSRAGRRGDDGAPGEKGERGPRGPMPISGAMSGDLIILTFDDGSIVEIPIEREEKKDDDDDQD